MRIPNSETGYGLVAKLLHWLIGLLIIGLIWLGWWMVDLSYYDRWYNDALEIHKALGMIVLGLAGVKLLWMAFNRAPRFPDSVRRWQAVAARATHHTLVLMMLAIPVTGYLISTSDGKEVSIFGLLEVPALIGKNETVRDAAIALHFYLAYITAGLVVVHALAALKHQLIDRDGTLARMIWR